MKNLILSGVVLSAIAIVAMGCSVEASEDVSDTSDDALTSKKIPSGWNDRCVVIAPAGLNVRSAGNASASVSYTAQCHDWFYPEGAEVDGWVKVSKLPKGAEAGTKVDERYAAGYVKAQYLNCYKSASGIDAGVWINSVPACGPTGIDIQPVNKADVKRDAQTGSRVSDSNFSEAWLKTRSDGFSFFGKSALAGTAICTYATSTESGVVAQAKVGVGGEFYCQVTNKPGAKFYYWFK